jgi:hypothetical protein
MRHEDNTAAAADGNPPPFYVAAKPRAASNFSGFLPKAATRFLGSAALPGGISAQSVWFPMPPERCFLGLLRLFAVKQQKLLATNNLQQKSSISN